MEAFVQTLQYIEEEISYIAAKALLAKLSESDALHCLKSIHADNIISAFETINQVVSSYPVKMSDSEESWPIDRACPIKGVPIIFGKSPKVKQLMEQIRAQGLLVPEVVNSAMMDNDGEDDEQESDAEGSNIEIKEEDIKDELPTDDWGDEEDEGEGAFDKNETTADDLDYEPNENRPKNKSKRKQGTPKKKNHFSAAVKLEDELYAESTSAKKRGGRRFKDFKYRCEQCDEGFNGTVPLGRHYRDVHSVEKPFRCDECEKMFASVRTLKEHKLVNHTEHSANICNICGKSFSSSNYLKVHARVHTGERPYTCDQCAMAFKDISSLYSHIKVMHTSVAENKEYMCDICGKGFHCQRYLLAHKSRVHDTAHMPDEKSHKCLECGKAFRFKQTLKEHMEVHIKMEIACTECGKHFTHQRSYRRHVNAHKEGPFNCPKCGKKYKNKKSAEPHMKACVQSLW